MTQTMINRGAAESLRINQITEAVIGAAIDVHRELGPGLLETAYEQCLCYELSARRLAFRRQLPLPVKYKAIQLDCGYVLDLLVENSVIVELKSVEKIHPVHEAQLLTYLKLSKVSVGLLINFFVPILKDGVKRIVNNFPDP